MCISAKVTRRWTTLPRTRSMTRRSFTHARVWSWRSSTVRPFCWERVPSSSYSAGFKQYRNHIREEYGEDADRRALYGLSTEKIEVEKEDKSGKKRKGKEDIEVFDPNSISRYAVFFDEGSTQWEPNPEYNKAFVIGMQNTANDLLHANGYLFLNTVYRLLGLPETSEGQLVGWMMGKGDDFVDFGIYDNAYLRTEKRDFVNGFEPSILLDFNLDGVIYKEI